MFTLNYFWFFVVATYFMSAATLYGNRSGNTLTSIVGIVSFPALLVFLIFGFWKMPSWWMPLVMFAIGMFIVAIPSRPGTLYDLSAFIGIVGAPVFTVLAYLGLFGVI